MKTKKYIKYILIFLFILMIAITVALVLYLKSDVKITGGTGEEGSPFILK